MRVRAGTVAALLMLAGACMPAGSGKQAAGDADPRRGELSARAAGGAGTDAGATGLRELDVGTARPALLYVPASYRPGRPVPLVLMLHGAGGVPSHSIDLVRRHADRLGFIVLAPGSNAATWDVIAERRYGADVAPIDRGLRQVLAHYAIDPARIAIAGFSDGASYALSLGIANGELFSRVIAFSPGFMAPAREQGRPRIFVSHGVQDRVLPIERCSRRLVPSLEQAGYDVTYVEFPGGHIVPEELAGKAFSM